MKLKKLMLVTIILLAILTIGAASAADDVASDDLAVSDDSIDIIADGEDAGGNDGNDNENNENDGNDEGGDEDPYIEVPEEFDINDSDAVVVSLYCPHETNGVFYIDGDVAYYDDEGDERTIKFDPLIHVISEDDWGKTINWTVSDLSVKMVGNYWFNVHLLESSDDEATWDNSICDGSGDAVDYTQFRAKVFEHDEFALTNNNAIVSVYCPEGSSGTVTVYVRKGDDGDAIPYSKEVSQNVDNWLNWNIHDLGMDSMDEYFISVEANDNILKKGVRIEIVNPIYFNQDIGYIGFGSDFDHINILEVEVSSEITEGRIIITYNGEEIFNKTLADFSNVESTSDLIWFNPSHGPGPGDETIKIYHINSNNVDYEFEEGTYEFTATLIYGSSEPIENTGSVTVAKINIATEGDYSIAIFDAQEYELGPDWFYLAIITAPEGADGVVKITVKDNDFTYEKDLADLEFDNGGYVIFPSDFESLDEGEYEITIGYYENDELVIENSATLKFYRYDDEGNEGDGDDDVEDGVVIHVPDGDEKSFDLENEDDLNTAFAYVSVQNGFDGKIAIMIWNEEEGDEQELWSKSLDEITDSEEDSENDGFTVYRISLSNINNYGDLIDCGSFKLAFIDDNNDEIDSRSYNIEVDEDYDNIIRFWEDNEDEPSGEGDELEGVEFRSANAQNNDIVIVIPMANFPENIVNNFTIILIIVDEDQISTKISTKVKLDELDHDDSSYYIRVSDLGIDELEIGEGTGMGIIVQFYDADDNPIYYAQGGIGIFNSPYIFEEASILSFSDDVITFQEVPEGVDEFTVTIQKEGEDSVVKTFKFSELGNQYEDEEDEDEEGGVWYALTLSDLGINETGDYQITVKFSEELTYSGTLSVTRKIDVSIHNGEEEWDEESEPALREFTSVDELVAVMRFAENIKGSVNLAIGENDPIVIDFADLKYDPSHAPDNGRQILLNDLKITESGTYTINMTIYDENGELIYEDEFDLLVTVGDHNVEFNDAYYTAEILDVIKFTISTPLSSGQYYNIYFNNELAGKFSLDGIVITNNKFYDDIWGDGEDDDVKFIKYGDYNVNVTFFDGENESATLFTGNFSIKSLNMAADKDKYSIDENVTIIFDAQEAGGYYPVLYVEYAKGWGYMGPFFDEDWEMAFAGEEITELIKDGKFTVNIGKLPEGTNYIYVAYYLFDSEDAYHDDDDVVFDFHDLMPIEVSAPVEPVDPGLAISPIADVGEGVDVTVTVTANDTFKGVVTVLVNNNEVGTIDMGAGESSLVVGAGNFTVGENTVKVTSEAIDDFAAGEDTDKFNVTKKVVPPTPVDPGLSISPIADVEEGVDVTVTVTANETFNGVVTVLVGENVVGAIDFGAGESSLVVGAGNFTVGENTVKVTSEAIGDFAAGEGTVKFNVTEKVVPPTPVEHVDPALTIIIDNVIEGAPAVIKITTNDTFSGDVLVQIANGNYTVSVTNGTGSLPVAGLGVGTYNATAIFAATDVFKASEKNTTFTVASKVATSIAAPAVTTTYATSKNIVVTLKDANGNVLVGKDVTITLNGATKTIKTNDKGQASYAIGTKLAPKKYDATIKFAGDSTYIASEAKVKVTVNKAKAKMTAKKKTFKAKKKSKKYSIVLKTDKNKALKKVKVTIKVKGKTYTAKTNSKGKATFNLKKLTKKGKHTATVKFKGNKYYNAVTKKIKITVKK